MGLTEQLAQWVIDFPTAADLPAEARRRARLLLLDSIGCALAAVPSDTGQSTLKTIAALSDAPTCTIVGSNIRTSPANAVLANGALMRTLDLNDLYVGPHNIGHPSDNLAVVLPIAELRGTSGSDVVATMVMAYELFLRIKDLGTWVGTPWDPTSASSIAAPAIAGRLLGLNADQLANAIGLSAAHGGTLSAVRSGELSAGKSVANSIVASLGTLISLLAQQGLTGPRNALEGRVGIAENVFQTGDLSSIVEPLGDDLRIMHVSMKDYPCFGVSQAAAAAAIQAHGLVANPVADLRRVEVLLAETSMTSRLSNNTDSRRYPTTRESADHSYYFVVAAALLDGEMTLRQFENERWRDATVRALIDRIEVRTDARLNKYVPGTFPCCLKLTLHNGQTHEIEMPYAPGHARTLDRTVVEKKFHMYAAPLLTATQRSAIVDEIDDLEARPSLTNLLAQVVPSPA